MALIRSAADIARKWAEVTPRRRDEYAKGVAAPLRDWEAGAIAAKEAWEEGVSDAVGRDAFAKGVKRRGTAFWQKRTVAVGPGRWAQGIGVAQPEYEIGFGPFRDTIERVTLPPKGPKGDPENLRRVEVIAKALHEKKLELLR